MDGEMKNNLPRKSVSFSPCERVILFEIDDGARMYKCKPCHLGRCTSYSVAECVLLVKNEKNLRENILKTEMAIYFCIRKNLLWALKTCH
jgi:hypothetical protein